MRIKLAHKKRAKFLQEKEMGYEMPITAKEFNCALNNSFLTINETAWRIWETMTYENLIKTIYIYFPDYKTHPINMGTAKYITYTKNLCISATPPTENNLLIVKYRKKSITRLSDNFLQFQSKICNDIKKSLWLLTAVVPISI